MNEFDAMRALAEANPVQAEDLAPIVAPARSDTRLPGRSLVVVIALAVLVAALAYGGSNSGVRDRARRDAGYGQAPGLRGPTGALGPTGARGTCSGLCDGPTGFTGPTGRTGPTFVGGPPATGSPSGPTGSRGPSNVSHGPGLAIGFSHGKDGSLRFVGVTIWEFKKTGVRMQIRYLGPTGDYLQGGYPVVFSKTLSADDMSATNGPVGVGPSGRGGPGPTAWTWSGRSYVSQWEGGCRSGDYEVDLDYSTTGPFSEDATTDTFHCTGH